MSSGLSAKKSGVVLDNNSRLLKPQLTAIIGILAALHASMSKIKNDIFIVHMS